MRKILGLLALALAVNASLASTESNESSDVVRTIESGNTLVQKCPRGIDSEAYCLGYVAGVVDLVFQLEAAPVGLSVVEDLCLPDGAELGQFAGVLSNYFDDHPEGRHYAASSSALLALHEAFGCSGAMKMPK